MCSCNPNRDFVTLITNGNLHLWELPLDLQGLYYLGEAYGYQQGLTESRERLEALEDECDRLYTCASQGSFKGQLKPQGDSFATLCRLRGDNALADQVEADWELLLRDREVSRQLLIEDRRQLTKRGTND